ncbi:MAG: hypothetical protein JXA42_27130 [Anaerolineales bacterium]|nr:hypothetical protein [Anaerolineales bacterium]
MQIAHVHVEPVEIKLRFPFRSAIHKEINSLTVLFVRVETKQGLVGWGCAAFDSAQTGEELEQVTRACQACAERARDLNPMNTEFALEEIAKLTKETPSVQCAFEMVFYDLLGLAAGLPLYRLLGGYRDRILTSITVGIGPERETVETALKFARDGFRIIKIKGGLDPMEDVRRVQSVYNAIPGILLRLDADHSYTARQAMNVSQALAGKIEMLERPIKVDDLKILKQITRQSEVPILIDAGVAGPQQALGVAAERAADGLAVRLATCGGFRCGRQIDTIARSANIATMVGCINEPALLTAAGLGFALGSSNVRYVDLDGHFNLQNDPSRPRFKLDAGWLISSDVPGLGCTVDL